MHPASDDDDDDEPEPVVLTGSAAAEIRRVANLMPHPTARTVQWVAGLVVTAGVREVEREVQRSADNRGRGGWAVANGKRKEPR
jgi:hypothetical protein